METPWSWCKDSLKFCTNRRYRQSLRSKNERKLATGSCSQLDLTGSVWLRQIKRRPSMLCHYSSETSEADRDTIPDTSVQPYFSYLCNAPDSGPQTEPKFTVLRKSSVRSLALDDDHPSVRLTRLNSVDRIFDSCDGFENYRQAASRRVGRRRYHSIHEMSYSEQPQIKDHPREQVTQGPRKVDDAEKEDRDDGNEDLSYRLRPGRAASCSRLSNSWNDSIIQGPAFQGPNDGFVQLSSALTEESECGCRITGQHQIASSSSSCETCSSNLCLDGSQDTSTSDSVEMLSSSFGEQQENHSFSERPEVNKPPTKYKFFSMPSGLNRPHADPNSYKFRRNSNNDIGSQGGGDSREDSGFGGSIADDFGFCSGRNGGESEADVDFVFSAVVEESEKEENRDKDLFVIFVRGGELKILHRPTSLHGGSHFSDIPPMTRTDRPYQNGSYDYQAGRSVRDLQRPRSVAIVSRSQSFGGMAHRQKEAGPPSSPAIVLGESFRHHRSPATMPSHVTGKQSPGIRGQTSFNYKKSPKVPKVPRPNRALLMFQSVKKGIREFIEATKEDIAQLHLRESDGSSLSQQIKSAERYLKRLEFHLSKLDELHEFYLLQQQLREGVRTMHKAYVTSPGNQRDTLASVKYGYKECTQTMCSIEAQLESMMGTFNCKLKGMAGFARLCPGDVFEVTVRHGTQKWKTKGRVEKSGNQRWDIPEFTFKAVVGDIINIKGVELRSFKSIILGQKSCETKDLFSANPQLMTVSINVNGSLKLSIIITWNPMDGVDENMTLVEAPLRAQSTPRRRPVSVIALNGQYGDDDFAPERRFSSPVSLQQTKDDNFILRAHVPHMTPSRDLPYQGMDSPQSRHTEYLPMGYGGSTPQRTMYPMGSGVAPSPVSTPDLLQEAVSSSAHTQSYEREEERDSPSPASVSPPPQSPVQTDSNAGQPVLSSSLPPMFSTSFHLPGAIGGQSVVTKETDNSSFTLEEAVQSLSSSLEDYHGQYSELQKLEDLVTHLDRLLRKQSRSSSRSSSISVSIEDALDAFDFLNTEEATEDPTSPVHKKSGFDDILCSPESTAKTGDSGIESLAQRLSEDTQLGSSLGSSPVPPSTGNEDVDQCLVFHLSYCERLLENLGAFGPCKCREIYALDKLQKQTDAIGGLLKIAKAGSEVDLHAVMTGLCDDKTLREFWARCTEHHSLYVHPDRLVSSLEQKYGAMILESYLLEPVRVCKHLVTRLLDVADFEVEASKPNACVTVYQFMMFFSENGGHKHVEEVAAEMRLIEKFSSGNPDVVIKSILSLRDMVPSAPCLKVLGTLLVGTNQEVRQCAISYLSLIQKKKEVREKALVVYVEGLEDRSAEIRSGACAALDILEATEGIDQLVYLWQSDSSREVQQQAKDALTSLGEEGKKVLEEAQLSRHGFQGIQMRM